MQRQRESCKGGPNILKIWLQRRLKSKHGWSPTTSDESQKKHFFNKQVVCQALSRTQFFSRLPMENRAILTCSAWSRAYSLAIIIAVIFTRPPPKNVSWIVDLRRDQETCFVLASEFSMPMPPYHLRFHNKALVVCTERWVPIFAISDYVWCWKTPWILVRLFVARSLHISW